jgi:hypothetical protein
VTILSKTTPTKLPECLEIRNLEKQLIFRENCLYAHMHDLHIGRVGLHVNHYRVGPASVCRIMEKNARAPGSNSGSDQIGSHSQTSKIAF